MGTLVLYHAHCPDGFGAAWSAWRRLGDDAEYVPVRHGAPAPEVPVGSSVFLLDFCYRRAVIEAMRERAGSLLVIDHHRTAEEELAGLDCGIFDGSQSGAVLAWKHFHPDTPVPELLRYVMDRDLWRHELPHSREVSAALGSYPMDFQVWSGLSPERLAEEGVPIRRYQARAAGQLADQARIDTVAGYQVPVANAPVLGSDVGEELLRRHPEAPFVAMYFDRSDGIRQWSLRSRPDFDVSEIARRFQNGGHRQAAGFESRIPDDLVPPVRSGAGRAESGESG